jgi:hypothetical protein
MNILLAGAGFASISMRASVHRTEHLRIRASWLKYEMNRVYHCAKSETAVLNQRIGDMRASMARLRASSSRLDRCMTSRGML